MSCKYLNYFLIYFHSRLTQYVTYYYRSPRAFINEFARGRNECYTEPRAIRSIVKLTVRNNAKMNKPVFRIQKNVNNIFIFVTLLNSLCLISLKIAAALSAFDSIRPIISSASRSRSSCLRIYSLLSSTIMVASSTF